MKAEPVKQLTVSERRVEEIINDLLLMNIELSECDDMGPIKSQSLYYAQRKLLEAVESLNSL